MTPKRLQLAEGGEIDIEQVIEIIDMELRTVRTRTGAIMKLSPQALRLLQRLKREEEKQ